MVTLDSTQLAETNSSSVIEPTSSPRISFSSDFLEDNNINNDTRDLISSSPLRDQITSTSNKSPHGKNRHVAVAGEHFEFLSEADALGGEGMITADELFFEGKLLPFWQAHTAERLAKISLGSSAATVENRREDCHVSGGQQQQVNGSSVVGHATAGAWFVDDDPSPRPPKCTVLWKELLRLRKQRATSTLSPSSSTSSSSSSSSEELLAGKAKAKGGGSGKGGNNGNNGGQNGNVIKGATRKGLERTRSATIRIRPMFNVPICSQVKSGHVSVASSLPPLFPLKKGKLFDR